jgi:polysaccharide pyruvyl transferase WcaK-like protein
MDSFWTHDQAAALYARARMVIRMELHSMLMAIPQGTPIIHIPFAEVGRKSQFIDDMGLGRYLMDIDRTPVEEIVEPVRHLDRERHAVSRLLRESITPYGRELEARAMEVIRRVVKERDGNPLSP